MKHFILTTIVLFVLWFNQYLYFNYGNHNWSKLGYRENSNRHIFYSIYAWLYLVFWILYLIITFFIPWYVNLKQ